MRRKAPFECLRWEELTALQITSLAQQPHSVAMVPVGSIEQHGPHLPTGTDSLLVNDVCRAAAKRCTDLNVVTVVTPALWLGRSFHHADLGGTLSARLETFLRSIEDIAMSFVQVGFQRQIFVNGHGGNAAALDAGIQEIGARNNLRIMSVTYFNLGREVVQKTRLSSEGGMGHACEFETSLMQYLHPDLVGELPRGKSRKIIHSAARRDMFVGGVANIAQRFSELSENGVVGQPQFANSENGKLWFDSCVQGLVEIVQELSSMTLAPS